MEQEGKPALTVVGGNPRLNYPPRPPRRLGDSVPIILPEINVFTTKWQFECELLGLTDWQRNRAWRIVCHEKDKAKYWQFRQANNRVFLIWEALGDALEWERREALAILQEHHPDMTRRIMKGLQRQEPKRRRKR